MASFYDEILADVDKLTDEQKAQLMAKLMAEMPEYENVRDAKNENGDSIPVACPHCGSIDIKKHGKVNDKQRYKCKDCDKTFNESTGSITQHSHLSKWQWEEIIRGMVLIQMQISISFAMRMEYSALRSVIKVICTIWNMLTITGS